MWTVNLYQFAWIDVNLCIFCGHVGAYTNLCESAQFFANVYKSRWIFSNLHDSNLYNKFEWIGKNLSEFVLLWRIRRESVLIRINFSKSARICVSLHQCAWLGVNLWAFLWIYVKMYKSLCIGKNFYESAQISESVQICMALICTNLSESTNLSEFVLICVIRCESVCILINLWKYVRIFWIGTGLCEAVQIWMTEICANLDDDLRNSVNLSNLCWSVLICMTENKSVRICMDLCEHVRMCVNLCKALVYLY